MKKKLMALGVCGIVCLLIGAVGLEVVEVRSNTVETWSDCFSSYLELRAGLPPLPLQSSPEELLAMAEQGNWSFIADEHWHITQPQTLYVAADSELAKVFSGELPQKLMIAEDIRLGSIIIHSVDEKGTWSPEAMFDAPQTIIV